MLQLQMSLPFNGFFIGSHMVQNDKDIDPLYKPYSNCLCFAFAFQPVCFSEDIVPPLVKGKCYGVWIS